MSGPFRALVWLSAMLIVLTWQQPDAAAGRQRVADRHFTSHICPYNIGYPASWKPKLSSSRDEFDGPGRVAVQVSCQKAPKGVTMKQYVRLFSTLLRKRGARVTLTVARGGIGHVNGSYPPRLTGRVVYYEIGLFIGRGMMFQAQLIALTHSTLKNVEPTYLHMLNTMSFQ